MYIYITSEIRNNIPNSLYKSLAYMEDQLD